MHTRLDASLQSTMPNHFKSVARVVVYRSGSEHAFSVYANVHRKTRQLSLAGMTDLGGVMFAMTCDQGVVTIKKNPSGWDDSVLTTVIAPIMQTIFLPQLTEYAIIKKDSGGNLLHQSRRQDGSLETFVFDSKGGQWNAHTLRSYMLFGEIERIRRIRFQEFKPLADWPAPFPHRIDIDDERHGFKATISVRSLTVL
ncbi:hypothetical protein BVX99_00225 [bacterium F16]|nr:hypothetical protein BVX99_00225 [bacterium F16]